MIGCGGNVLGFDERGDVRHVLALLVAEALKALKEGGLVVDELRVLFDGMNGLGAHR